MLYTVIFRILKPSIISNSPDSTIYKIFKLIINIIIFFKKKSKGKIQVYKIDRRIGVLKFYKYDFIAFKLEDLINLEELIMIKYYLINKKNYKNFLDFGANIGLHTIIAKKLGYNVKSFEPDKKHFLELKRNCQLNNVRKINLYQKAVFNKKCIITFVKVKNNTTANHILGRKQNLYGPIEKQIVYAVKANTLFKGNDLVKIDVEGAEFDIIKSIKLKSWNNIDCFVSIHNKKIAKQIYNFFIKKKINLFSSKKNWKKVLKFSDMPQKHPEGLLFISSKKNMNWN